TTQSSQFGKVNLLNPMDNCSINSSNSGINNNHNHISNGTTSRSRILTSNKLTSDQISLPQNDFRHIGHVGSDGRTFGDLGIVGKMINSNDNLSDSQSLHNFNGIEGENHKYNNKSNTLQINPSNIKMYQEKTRTTTTTTTTKKPVVDSFISRKFTSSNKNDQISNKSLTTNNNHKQSITVNINNNDTDVDTDTDLLFDDLKFNVLSESN
ncbi:unnamed protein product, partial [Schistosoma turkestanicum]